MTNVIGARNVGARREAGRGPADPHRAGPLRRRRRAAGDAARGVPAQPGARTAAPLGRRVGGARAARGGRRLHGRGPRRGSPSPARPAPRSGCNMMPGLKSPPSTRWPPTRSATSATRSRWSSPRDRYIAEDALELIVEDIELLDPIVTYEDALDPSQAADCSTSSATTSPSPSEMALGDVDAAFAKADRVVASEHLGAPPRSRCRWSAAGSIASWDPATRAPHDPRVDAVAAHARGSCCRCRSTCRWRRSGSSPATSAAASA